MAVQGLYDLAVQHRIRLEALGTGVGKQILKLLNASFNDVSARLTERLAAIEVDGFDAGPQTTQRLQFLLDDLEALIKQAYGASQDVLVGELEGLATYEAEWTQKAVQSATSVNLNLTVPTTTVLEAIATTDPIAGSLMSEWTEDLSAATRNRIRQAIRSGVLEGKTTAEIVRSIKGTRAAGYSDGLLEISRRNAQTWVRTSVAGVAARARQITLQENSDIVVGERWVSVLDSRTTPICRARDGKVYPVGEGPRPPAHPNCRSVTVPVLKGEENKKPAGERASVNGPVKASLTYGQWLKQQPEDFVREVLGPSRAKLFMDGGLKIDAFVRDDGHEYTLPELREREKSAFNRAGI